MQEKRALANVDQVLSKQGKKAKYDEEQFTDEDIEMEMEQDDKDTQDRAGSILKVELHNFMCHSQHTTHFGKHVNFLTGPNGSGKSAILSALTVALGGKASFTNRAASLSKLLKEGEEVGEVSVYLRNSGIEAYQPEIYGDVITVVRTINQGSGGKTQQTTKEAVDKMLDHFAIDIDNPTAILTQDNAKVFLSKSTPQQKYKLFNQSTSLEKLDNELQHLEQKLNDISATVESRNKDLPDLKRELSIMVEQYKDLQASETLEVELNNLEGERIWAKVCQMERKLAKSIEAEQELLKQKEEMAEKFKEVEDDAQAAESTSSVLSMRYTECKSRLEKMANEIEAEKRILNEKRDLVDKSQSEIDEVTQNIQSYQDQVQKCQEQIVIEKKNESVNQDDAIRQLNQKLNDHERNVKDISSQQEKVTENIEKLEERLQKANDELAKAYQEGSLLENDLNAAKVRVSNLNNQKSNGLFAFGKTVSDVVMQIQAYEADKRWKGKMPIGPFGLHIELSDMKYSDVVESHMNQVLNGFGVECQEDFHTLNSILRRFNCKSSIYKYRPSDREFDYSSGIPSPELRTMLSILRFNNPIVKQQSIILTKIESTVLVENHTHGDNVLRNGYPTKVSRILTAQCFEVGSRSGGLSTSTMNKYKGQKRLTKNLEEDIRDAKKYFEARRQEYENFKRREQNLRMNVDTYKRDIKREHDHYVTLEDQKGSLMLKIDIIGDKLNTRTSSKIPGLQQRIEALMEKLKIYNSQLKAMEDTDQDLKKAYNEIGSRVNSLRKDLITERQGLKNITDELNNAKSSYIQKSREHGILREKLYDCSEKYTLLSEKVEEIRKAVSQQSEACAEVYQRVDTSRSEEEITIDIRKLQAKLKGKTSEYGNIEDFKKKLVKKQQSLQEALTEISSFQQIHKNLEMSLTKRRAKVEGFRRRTSSRMVIVFQSRLQKRQYRGKLLIDHEAKSLSIDVATAKSSYVNDDDDDEDEGPGDPKTLSGGEKSYTQICFLISLWEVSDNMPFRCLDEFDVFMDGVNRRLAMKQLIEYSREKNDTQFLLISPQKVDDLHQFNGTDIRLLKLKPPERGQTQINFPVAS